MNSASNTYKLNDLLQGLTEGPVGGLIVSGLSLDSRTVKVGDLFVALSGTQAEGHRFITQAIESGAVAVVCDDTVTAREHTVSVIGIKDIAHKVGVIAERFYNHPSRNMFMVGVTGTNGKTSCAHFIAQALNSEVKPCAIIGTLGNGLVGDLEHATHTTPDAISLHGMMNRFVAQGAKQAVMEVSSHGLEQGRVSGVDFDVAVFTNLSRDHLDYHGDMESYGNAKARLFQMPKLQHAVINADDAFGLSLLDSMPGGVKVVAYTLGDAQFNQPTVRGSDLVLSRDGLKMNIQSPWGNGEMSCALLGRFNASNVLAVVATLLLSGMSFENVRAHIASLKTVPGRMERFGKQGQPLVVVDYAHTPDALQQVLSTLREHCDGQLWCVFGCGGDRDKGKRPQMGAIAKQYADVVVISDDNPRHENADAIVKDIEAGIADLSNVTVIRDRASAIRYAVSNAAQNDVVLVAGKGHEDYQQIGDKRLPFSDSEHVIAALKEAA